MKAGGKSTRLCIIIPHYGDWAVTARCLAAVQTFTPAPLRQVHVWDDGSGTAPTKAPAGVTLHRQPHNGGFTATVNAALLALPGYQYYAILNNDVEVCEGWTAVLDTLDAHPEAAGATPSIRLTRDPEHVVFVQTHSAIPGMYQPGHASQDEARDVHPLRWMPFTAPILRGAALAQVGLLDPNMRHICSDSDWCYRARAMGWTILYAGTGTVLHDHVETTPGGNDYLRECFIADRAWLMDKWTTGRAWLALDNTEEEIAPYAGDWQRWHLAGRRDPLWSRPPAVAAG